MNGKEQEARKMLREMDMDETLEAANLKYDEVLKMCESLYKSGESIIRL